MLLTMAGAGSDKSHVMSPARDFAGLQGRRNRFSILNSRNGFFEKRGEKENQRKAALDGGNEGRASDAFLEKLGVLVKDIRQSAQNVRGTVSRRADAPRFFKNDRAKRWSLGTSKGQGSEGEPLLSDCDSRWRTSKGTNDFFTESCNSKAVREREGVPSLYAGGPKHLFEGITDGRDWKAGQNNAGEISRFVQTTFPGQNVIGPPMLIWSTGQSRFESQVWISIW